MAEYATNDVVGVHWLKTLDGLPSSNIATRLPSDNSSWAASGFVTATVIAGSPDIYLDVHRPVFQINCWATNPNSGKPPWGKSNRLANLIQKACLVPSNFGVLSTPSFFEDVRVMSAYPLTEAVRVHGDEARFAIHQFDLKMHWVRVPS